jgi:hypothetical protein
VLQLVACRAAVMATPNAPVHAAPGGATVRAPGALPYDPVHAARHTLPNEGAWLPCANPHCRFLNHTKATVADGRHCCLRCSEAAANGSTAQQCIAQGVPTHGKICEHRPAQ